MTYLAINILHKSVDFSNIATRSACACSTLYFVTLQVLAALIFTLKVEAAWSSEMLISYQITEVNVKLSLGLIKYHNMNIYSILN
jgi:hypothetical protein